MSNRHPNFGAGQGTRSRLMRIGESTKQLMIRLSDRDAMFLAKTAGELKLTKSDFIRTLISEARARLENKDTDSIVVKLMDAQDNVKIFEHNDLQKEYEEFAPEEAPILTREQHLENLVEKNKILIAKGGEPISEEEYLSMFDLN